MNSQVLLILPPFTQLNTPYPATAYLKGFLNTRSIASSQCDLGIEVILRIFSKHGLQRLFNAAESKQIRSENSLRIFALRNDYVSTIDLVISFLQYKNPTIAHAICGNDLLPQASRFNQLDDLEYAFGTMGQQDKARHLATLYLEDLSDFIKDEIDPHFGFSRYAESLGRSASTFDQLSGQLVQQPSFTDTVLLELLTEKIAETNPSLVAVSVPFPGNLYGAFRCAQWIKKNHPEVKIALGGGYANTELRSLSDPRVFDYIDFVTLDDGEAPIVNLVEYLNGKRALEKLKRTFARPGDEVIYFDNSETKDFSQAETGTPDYTGLPLDKYLSVIELTNPMHSLWSNGRWNKLTLAHGCYWGKCTFCDITLDYIRRYEQSSVSLLCDRIEELIQQTGETGFHFVDEAAPPVLLRDLAIEILRRDLKITWWTNIRFEKSFTRDLCRLLKASGCIAMSGGLEVASDRLLELIDKGVTVAQVATVCRNFKEAGILVHAYLMYGYPTQTKQETIDSLEMVRQLFETGVLQSGFWHRFAMTAHSPVGIDPAKYKAKILNAAAGTFANNDLEYTEENGVDHEIFSEGLRVSLFNYMHGVGFDVALREWFQEDVPKTIVAKNYIAGVLSRDEELNTRPSAKLIFLGNAPQSESISKTKKGKQVSEARFRFISRQYDETLILDNEKGKWLAGFFPKLVPAQGSTVVTLKELKEDFEQSFPGLFDTWWKAESAALLRLYGLLVL